MRIGECTSLDRVIGYKYSKDFTAHQSVEDSQSNSHWDSKCKNPHVHEGYDISGCLVGVPVMIMHN